MLCFYVAGTNEALQEFLLARNPKNQHSGTLESYLIKPIQVGFKGRTIGKVLGALVCVCVWGGGGDRPLEKCRGIFCLYDIFLTPSSLQDFFDSS